MEKSLNKRLTIAILIIGMIVLAIGGCNQEKSQSTPRPIRIGVIAPLTGEAASYGQAAKAGLDFAVKEVNRKGGLLGRQIELDYEDSQADPKNAVTAMKRFTELDKTGIVIVADGSGPTMAVSPLADQTNTLVIATLASTPQLSTAGDFVFRTVPSDSYQGKELARIAENEGCSRAGIIHTNDPYGKGISETFIASFKGETLIQEEFENGANDFRTSLIKISKENPDCILIVASDELPSLLKQIRQIGIQSVLLASETAKNEKMLKEAGEAAEGLHTVFYAEPEDYAKFRTNFKKETERDPPAYSDYSYDAIVVLTDAVKKIGSVEPDALRNELYKIESYGSTGIIRFDSNGEVADKPFTHFKVDGGRFVIED